jgi:hypothetical protein
MPPRRRDLEDAADRLYIERTCGCARCSGRLSKQEMHADIKRMLERERWLAHFDVKLKSRTDG